jgi:hypothetical protein
MAAEGLPVRVACRTLEVSVSGYYDWRARPPSIRSIRHAWLTDLIRQVHVTSRQTYGSRRVHAELTIGRGIAVGYHAVELLMRRAGLRGVTGAPKYRRTARPPTAAPKKACPTKRSCAVSNAPSPARSTASSPLTRHRSIGTCHGLQPRQGCWRPDASASRRAPSPKLRSFASPATNPSSPNPTTLTRKRQDPAGRVLSREKFLYHFKRALRRMSRVLLISGGGPDASMRLAQYCSWV